jgi:hypothetical protein
MQNLFVVAIVVAAALYAVWALLPVTTRHSLAGKAARALGGSRQSGLRGRVARRLQGIADAPARGCSDCPAHIATPAERARKADRG